MGDTGGVRLFVGVWPPEPVRVLLAHLPRPEEPGLRWTTEEQWHVTAVFLGDVDAAALPALGHALDRAAAVVPPGLIATMGPATGLLGRQVLCVPVAGLDPLADAVRAAVAPLCQLEARPFRGHLTLARVRGRRRVPPALSGLPLAAEWRVDDFSLVASTLDPGSARYRTLSTHRLG